MVILYLHHKQEMVKSFSSTVKGRQNMNGIYLFVLAEMQSFSIMVILVTTEVMRNLWTFILHGTFGMVVTLWKSHQAEILSGNMKILITIMTLSGCITAIYFTQLHHLSLSKKVEVFSIPKFPWRCNKDLFQMLFVKSIVKVRLFGSGMQ